MLELEISQVKTRLTELLSQTVYVLDAHAKERKAVLLPYAEYKSLLAKAAIKEELSKGAFNKFVGILDSSFKTQDEKYQEILKWRFL